MEKGIEDHSNKIQRQRRWNENCMNITWITGRDLNVDLASTTEVGLIEALSKKNHIIRVMSPTASINNSSFQHTRFKKIKFKGMETLSAGYFLNMKLKSNNMIQDFSDCVLVDWCYVPSLKVELLKMKKPWFIIDRGPPVYRSLLTKIQKRIWKRAWKIASESASGGFVVSEGHKKLVNKIGLKKIEIHTLNAGTDKNHFNENIRYIDDLVILSYCGRIDKNRGILSIIELSKELDREEIKHIINLMGEGDYINHVKNISNKSQSIIYHGKLPRSEVYEILQNSHFGIMPMPDKKVWKAASPIKLAEYMASGLLIIGQDHPGNRTKENEEWSFLIKGAEWFVETPEVIKSIIENNSFQRLSELSKVSSEKYDWSIISDKMIEYIQNRI